MIIFQKVQITGERDKTNAGCERRANVKCATIRTLHQIHEYQIRCDDDDWDDDWAKEWRNIRIHCVENFGYEIDHCVEALQTEQTHQRECNANGFPRTVIRWKTFSWNRSESKQIKTTEDHSLKSLKRKRESLFSASISFAATGTLSNSTPLKNLYDLFAAWKPNENAWLYVSLQLNAH